MLIYNGFLWSFNKPGKCLHWTPRAGITDEFTYHFLDAPFPLVVLALF